MPTTTDTRNRPPTLYIADPFYAAAGAGDLAYEQLRKLPERVAELREKVAELRPNVTEAVTEDRLRTDIKRLRAVARRNAKEFREGMQEAQERAVAAYNELVERGKRVVRTGRTPGRVTLTVQAEPAEDNHGEHPTTAQKAVKRTRPAAQK
jgi:heparin binding hemagglutinin HbhA